MSQVTTFAAFLVSCTVLPFVAGEYFLSVGLNLLMWIALTQSWSLLSGLTGYISLGHVVFYGLGAYLAAITWGHLPLWAVLILAGFANFVFATVISMPVLRVRGPYFVILTFGLAELVKFVVMAVESKLGQFGRLLFNTPSTLKLYWLMLGFAVVATAATQIILSTRLGQGLLAIREDEEAAETIGVPVTLYKSIAFGLSAVIPGVVGALMILRTTYFEPQQVFDPIVSFTIVTIAIIGRKRQLARAVIRCGVSGSAFGDVLGNGTSDLSHHSRYDVNRVCRVHSGRDLRPVPADEGSDMTVTVLELQSVSRRFGGLTAVNDVNLSVSKGEIVGIMGANGAGKTTLFALIAGHLAPTGGDIQVNGDSIVGLSPYQICRRGVSRTFQTVRPFGDLTAFDNVLIAARFRCAAFDQERRFGAGGLSGAYGWLG